MPWNWTIARNEKQKQTFLSCILLYKLYNKPTSIHPKLFCQIACKRVISFFTNFFIWFSSIFPFVCIISFVSFRLYHFVCIISFHKVEKQINNSKKFSHDEHLINVLFVALHEKIHISNPVPFPKFIIIPFIKHHYNFIFIILVVVNAGQATRVIQAMILWMIVLLPWYSWVYHVAQNHRQLFHSKVSFISS